MKSEKELRSWRQYEMVELNMTTSMISGVGSLGSWFSVFIIVSICIFLLCLFISALASFEQYARTKRWLRWILNTLRYFGFGILTLLVIALPVLVVYYFLSQAHKGNVAPLKITSYLIGGYIVICIIGWIGKNLVYNRIKKFDKKYQKELNDEKKKKV